MPATHKNADISVVLITQDPYFLFAARGLLGRSRRVRIRSAHDSLDAFEASLHTITVMPQAIVCDLDTASRADGFYEKLRDLVGALPYIHFICLAESNLDCVTSHVEAIAISALLSKRELGYCLHLAIDAAVNERAVLVTQAIRILLHKGSYLAVHCKTIGLHQDHPFLSARLAEILLWRIFIGLDNADIQDELLLGGDTVRGYVSMAYKALGVNDELGAFEALSEWWWTTRFARIL